MYVYNGAIESVLIGKRFIVIVKFPQEAKVIEEDVKSFLLNLSLYPKILSTA